MEGGSTTETVAARRCLTELAFEEGFEGDDVEDELRKGRGIVGEAGKAGGGVDVEAFKLLARADMDLSNKVEDGDGRGKSPLFDNPDDDGFAEDDWLRRERLRLKSWSAAADAADVGVEAADDELCMFAVWGGIDIDIDRGSDVVIRSTGSSN
ncbi:hypothetical protein HDV05_006608 [Chytridiales sp. JEL 0842]|nr:hypothetical protein HDV05_006608 [Chytridiales sp. JEL 0842]